MNWVCATCWKAARKGGNRVRITAQLIDAATGNHIWADRYDGELTDSGFGLLLRKMIVEPHFAGREILL